MKKYIVGVGLFLLMNSCLNNDFMESYKHLDKICKEIFNSEKGVTTYIDTMKEVNDGNRYVPLWNKTLSDHMKTSRLTLGDCITSFSAMHIKQDKLMRFLKEIMKLTI